VNIEYSGEAYKQIKKLPKNELKKIIRRIETLSLSPRSGKVLQGELVGLRCLRAWPYRIIYEIEEENAITIHSIGHRQGVYK
jgi:mRNA interferase RelE/StbE